jgi:type II secretory pathway pseudopilin PulG
MIVVAIIALLAAIAIPNVLRGRTTANEAASIGNLRALMSSVEMYRSVYQAYPSNWDLDMYTNVTPAFGPPSFNLNIDGGPQAVQGFNYQYWQTGTGSFELLAAPVTANDGSRSFYLDQTGLIAHCSGTGTRAQLNDGNEATIDAQPNTCD